MTPITIIGSCRVYEPLLQAGIVMNQNHITGYTHNTKEHLQLLRLGKKGAPATDMIAKITNIPVGYKGFSNIPSDGRWFILEICSIRIVEYQNWYLQINKFFNYCSQFSEKAMNAKSFSSEEELKRNLRLCGGLPLDIEALKYYEQSESELLNDLRELYDLLKGRVLFVSHFNTDRSGNSIWQRERILTCLNKLYDEVGAHIFDPTPHLKAFGVNQGIKDLGHYTPEFESYLSKILSERILTC